MNNANAPSVTEVYPVKIATSATQEPRKVYTSARVSLALVTVTAQNAILKLEFALIADMEQPETIVICVKRDMKGILYRQKDA